MVAYGCKETTRGLAVFQVRGYGSWYEGGAEGFEDAKKLIHFGDWMCRSREKNQVCGLNTSVDGKTIFLGWKHWGRTKFGEDRLKNLILDN